MDSRHVGHAQRRRIGAPAYAYDPDYADYDDGGYGSESESTLAGTQAMRDNPAGAAAAANERLAMMRGYKKTQDIDPAAARAEAKGIASKSGGSELIDDALGFNGEHPESFGAHRIRGTRAPAPDPADLKRSGVITSVPVSTNYQAIQQAFANRQVQNKIRRGVARDGEMGSAG